MSSSFVVVLPCPSFVVVLPYSFIGHDNEAIGATYGDGYSFYGDVSHLVTIGTILPSAPVASHATRHFRLTKVADLHYRFRRRRGGGESNVDFKENETEGRASVTVIGIKFYF